MSAASAFTPTLSMPVASFDEVFVLGISSSEEMSVLNSFRLPCFLIFFFTHFNHLSGRYPVATEYALTRFRVKHTPK